MVCNGWHGRQITCTGVGGSAKVVTPHPSLLHNLAALEGGHQRHSHMKLLLGPSCHVPSTNTAEIRHV